MTAMCPLAHVRLHRKTAGMQEWRIFRTQGAILSHNIGDRAPLVVELSGDLYVSSPPIFSGTDEIEVALPSPSLLAIREPFQLKGHLPVRVFLVAAVGGSSMFLYSCALVRYFAERDFVFKSAIPCGYQIRAGPPVAARRF